MSTTTPEQINADQANHALTSEDRCDACGAQAYVRVDLAAGSQLNFCAHHARKHSAKLEEVATHIHDETERLHADSAAR